MSTLTSLLLLLTLIPIFSAAESSGGTWQLLQSNTGVSAMHMQLLHNDRVIIFDRTDFGKSNLSLPNGKCRNDSNDKALKIDCTAHSIEYDVSKNTFRPLMVLTDPWCSSGAVNPDGTLIQTGGFNDGDRTARFFAPCEDGRCDWKETPQGALSARRWYATNARLPDGRAIVVGGRREFSYEFYPKSGPTASGSIPLRLLQQTTDPEENNLYPFVHLSVDGNVFIFANNRAILFDYRKNVVVRNYPVMPGGDPRNYPSSGSSVLLPLIGSGTTRAEVLICGGAPRGSYLAAEKNKTFVGALATCGRITITDRSPTWSMETMPMKRVMGDMVMLPTGQVLIINGAASGTAGWEFGQNPVLTPVVYSPNAAVGDRFKVQTSTTTPRLYHSTAILLRDTRVLVGGSNPHVGYQFYGVRYPTDLSLQAYRPDYFNRAYSIFRPTIISPATPAVLSYGKMFALEFTAGSFDGNGVLVTMIAPPFTTHSYSMNQRLLILETSTVSKGSSTYSVMATAPASGNLAPSGYYMVFVVNAGIPSEGIWVHIQ